MPFEYNKLRGRIIEKFGSQAKFAEALGITENTVSRKMNGFVQFSTTDIVSWAKLLGISSEDYGSYFFS